MILQGSKYLATHQGPWRWIEIFGGWPKSTKSCICFLVTLPQPLDDFSKPFQKGNAWFLTLNLHFQQTQRCGEFFSFQVCRIYQSTICPSLASKSLQGSKDLGKGLLEMACAPDGITEAPSYFLCPKNDQKICQRSWCWTFLLGIVPTQLCRDHDKKLYGSKFESVYC